MFILLLSPRLTGLRLHEFGGIILILPVVWHLLLSWQWIARTSKRVFTNANKRTRFNYFLNSTLFVLVIIEIVSGFAISQVALPFFGIKAIDDRSWRALHNQTLNWTVLFIGLHIAVNWRWVVTALHKPLNGFNIAYKNNVKTASSIFVLLRRISIILLAAGIIALIIYISLGGPSVSRLYQQDEIARFKPAFGRGIAQFMGEALLIALVTYIACRWLNIRL